LARKLTQILFLGRLAKYRKLKESILDYLKARMAYGFT